MSEALTEKRQRFVEEYLVDLNGTQAAIRAGYSAESASQEASRLLSIVNVQDAIADAKQKRLARSAITQDMVIAELALLGFSSMANYAAWNESGVTLIDSENLAADAMRCVAEVSQTVTESGGSTRFKLHDKKGALELLGRHLGIFNDKLALDHGKVTVNIDGLNVTPGGKNA